MSKTCEQKIRLTPEQYMAVIDNVKNTTSIQKLLDVAIKTTGIKMLSYHHIAGPGAYEHKNMEHHVCYNFPKPLERYLKGRELTQNDPGVIATFSACAPIWLSDMLEHELVKGLAYEPLITKLLNLTGDGLLLGLYGPEGRKGYVFAALSKPRDQYDPIFEWQVNAMLQMLHVRYCIMLSELQKKVKLTTREAEVLELITCGKTNPEIGIILNISKNTVASYIKRLFLKLDTSERVTTAMRARALNLLS